MAMTPKHHCLLQSIFSAFQSPRVCFMISDALRYCIATQWCIWKTFSICPCPSLEQIFQIYKSCDFFCSLCHGLQQRDQQDAGADQTNLQRPISGCNARPVRQPVQALCCCPSMFKIDWHDQAHSDGPVQCCMMSPNMCPATSVTTFDRRRDQARKQVSMGPSSFSAESPQRGPGGGGGGGR